MADDSLSAQDGASHAPRAMMNIPFDDDLPDIYADSINLNLGLYGISIVLGRVKGDLAEPTTVPVGVVRMSPQLALVLTQLLRKSLRKFQEDVGAINLPDTVLQSLEIDREL